MHAPPFLVLATTAALVLLPAIASAQGGAAATLFDEGRALMKEGRIAEACAKLDASNQLDHQVGTQLNLAACHDQEGKTASAWSEYEWVAVQSDRAGDAERARFARDQRAALERKLSRVRLRVPTGVQALSLDGKSLPAAGWSSALPLDPGPHKIIVDGREVAFDVAPGPSEQAVDVGPRAGATASGMPAPASDVPSSSGSASGVRTRRIIGYSLVGVGVLGVGVGTFFGLSALASKSDVDEVCVGRVCSTPAGPAAADDARSSGNVSTVALVIGGVALAAGAALVLWPSSQGATARRIDLAGVHF